MAHRAIVAGVAVLVLLSSVPLFMPRTRTSCRWTISPSSRSICAPPEGTSLEATEVLINRIAHAVRQQVPEVMYTLVTVGADQAKTRNLGNIYIRLTPIEERTRDQFAVMAAIRKDILPPLAPNLRTSVQEVATIGGSGSQAAAIQFAINGPDLKKLEGSAASSSSV